MKVTLTWCLENAERELLWYGGVETLLVGDTWRLGPVKVAMQVDGKDVGEMEAYVVAQLAEVTLSEA